MSTNVTLPPYYFPESVFEDPSEPDEDSPISAASFRRPSKLTVVLSKKALLQRAIDLLTAKHGITKDDLSVTAS